jgi:putative spermidine/putrescine transport system substrate-binding protein
MTNKKMTTLAVVVVAFSLLFVSWAAAEEKKIVVVGWGGDWEAGAKKAFGDPFEKETGIKVIWTAPIDFGKLKAMVEAKRPEWDVIAAAGMHWIVRAEHASLLDPIDYKVVNASLLEKQFVHEYAAGGQVESVLLAYRKDKYKTPPVSWADFWNVEKFPGKRSLPNRAPYTIEAALLADGVPADKLYPLDIDRAFKSLDRLKPHIATFWGSGAQSESLIRDGEVDMIAIWNGRASNLIVNQKAPVGVVWNQALYYQAAWAIVKGTPRGDLANKFINFVQRAENQAIMAKAIFYGPTNLAAFKFIDEATAKELPSYPEHFKKVIKIDAEYWREKNEPVTERLSKWIME